MARDLDYMMRDYRLTTAEILYHLPDYPALLQSYLWQEYDLAPQFPTLLKFLDYWDKNLDGRVHSVVVASRKLILPSEWRGAAICTTIQ